MMYGRVYFVSAPGRIKIGYTRRPDVRLQQLQSADMENLTMIGTIVGSRWMESEFHKKLSAFNIRGEWFTDCTQVREVINAALAGNMPVEPEPGEVHPREDRHSDVQINLLKSAINESKAIAAKIEDRLSRKEDITDLIDMAAFLAEKIIAPALGTVNE